MNIFDTMKLNDAIDEGMVHVHVDNVGVMQLKVGTIIRYKKAKNLKTYAGKVLAFDVGSAFQLKVETHMPFGKVITHHRVQDITQLITGESLHEAIRAANRANEQYRN